MRPFLRLLLLLALAGCARMDVAECRTADWRAIGYEDGVQGAGPGYFGERRKACAEHGITADFDTYMAGRAEGLVQFCSPHNGYSLGTRGYSYTGICPAELEDSFLSAHADGYGLYQRHAALKRVRARLNNSKQRLQEIEYLLVDRTALLVSTDLAPAERAAVAVELKQLTEEKIHLETDIVQLRYDHAQAQREYESYQASIAYRPES